MRRVTAVYTDDREKKPFAVNTVSSTGVQVFRFLVREQAEAARSALLADQPVPTFQHHPHTNPSEVTA